MDKPHDDALRISSRSEALALCPSANLPEGTPMAAITTIKRSLPLLGALAMLLLPAVSCSSCPSTPSVSSLSPSSATAGGADFTLTVNGHNFNSSSVATWDGASLTTSVVSSTQLIATIPSTDIAQAGTAEVYVYNPVGANKTVTEGTATGTDTTNCGAAGSNETPFTVSP